VAESTVDDVLAAQPNDDIVTGRAVEDLVPVVSDDRRDLSQARLEPRVRRRRERHSGNRRNNSGQPQEPTKPPAM